MDNESDECFDYKKYGEPHRMFLQGLMTRGIIGPDEFDHLFNLCLIRANVKPPEMETKFRQEAKKAFITTIRNTIESKTSLKLILVYNEERKDKKRGLLLSNQMDRSEDCNQLTIKAMVTFLPHELEYMKLLVKAIIDNPMRELSQTVALNMYKKVKKKKVTIAQSEATLEKFIEHKWLMLSKDENIRLSTRFIYEMEPYLNKAFKDKDLKCSFCERIVIRSVVCPNKACDSQFHVYCAAGSHNQCFKCEDTLPARRNLLNSGKSIAGQKRRKSSTT